MNQSARANVEPLLGSLYDGVMAPGGFQDFIEALSATFQLKAVTMIIRHADTHEVKGLWVYGLAMEWLESYVLNYAGEDLLAQHLTQAPIARFYASNLDLPHPERFPETRFYREWIVPQGVAYAAGGIVLHEGAWLTQMILQRAAHHPPFNRDELDQLNQLIPHLQRAIQMRQRFAELQFGQNFLVGGLDVLAMPTLLFDEYGRVAHCNLSATKLLSESSGLRIEGGHLLTGNTATTRQLSLELGNAIRASRGEGHELAGVVLLPRSGSKPLMLMIAPLRLTGATPRQGAALLFAFDPEMTPTVTADLIRRLFGLSEAESELAVALCSGKTLDETAIERGTSIHTTKSQLKSIFNKTGTNRQADLVSLLLASPAYFLAQDQQG
jgi:DNA-binding CsgD family transcriptional regulator